MFLNIFLTNTLAIIVFYIFLRLNRLIEHEQVQKRRRLLMRRGTLQIGLPVWGVQLMYATTMDQPPDFTVQTVLLCGLLSFGGSFLAIYVASREQTEIVYVTGSLALSAGTLLLTLLSNWLFFRAYAEFKPVHIMISFLLTFGFYLASLRYATQLSRETEEHKVRRWELAGSVLAGMPFAGIPLIYLHSILELPNPFAHTTKDAALIPYALELAFVFVLWLAPSLFSEEKTKEQEALLQENQVNYDLLFKNQPNPAFLIQTNGHVAAVNPQAEKLLEGDKSLLLSMPFTGLLCKSEQGTALSQFQRAIQGETTSWVLQMQTFQNSSYELEVTFIPIFSNQTVSGIFAILKDITEEKQQERLIEKYAYEDELTGLRNRRAFLQELQRVHQEAAAAAGSYAVLFLDMDRFKFLNDSFGHSFGDKIIQQFAKRIQECLSPQHTLFRLGGDEFTILLPHAPTTQEIKALAAHIIQHVSMPYRIAYTESHLTTSIGIAMYPADGNDPEQVMSRADMAMYYAKDHGKNQFKFYDEELDQNAVRRRRLEDDLRRAIAQNELMLHYQPKFNIMTEQITSVEALVRWRHPEFGMIPPDMFIPVAEETGLIIPLERWVIQRACADLKQFGSVCSRVAVNISQHHFHKEDFVPYILDVLERLHVSPQQLDIEVTESTMMSDKHTVVSKLRQLRALGVEVSMDDFGTGYSSLSNLKTLPINCLKIDRSFIRDVMQDESSKAIVTLIISMAKHLGLNVIAEGVETAEQVRLLRELQCHEIQGYYYSKPLPVQELAKLLQPV